MRTRFHPVEAVVGPGHRIPHSTEEVGQAVKATREEIPGLGTTALAVVALGLLDQIASAVQQETAAAEVLQASLVRPLHTQAAVVDLVSILRTLTEAEVLAAVEQERMEAEQQGLVERQIQAAAVVVDLAQSATAVAAS